MYIYVCTYTRIYIHTFIEIAQNIRKLWDGLVNYFSSVFIVIEVAKM